jgi:hypothetical protein
MAADWIKMRSDIYRDPKVSVIAEALMAREGDLARYVNQMCQRDMTVTRNVMRNVTVGALVSIWGVMRQRGKRCGDDLTCDGVTVSVLDDIADLPGIGAAMESAGWVIEDESGITFPNFFEGYNVDPAEKNASSNAERQRKYRERKAAEKHAEPSGESRNAGDVTRDVTVTHREEKSREEKYPPTPLDEIVELYHAKLPELPRVVLKTEARTKACRKFWQWIFDSRKSDGEPRAQTADQALTWIAGYFERASANDFLMGKRPTKGHENWRADFDFLLTERGRTHVIERTVDA